MKLQFRMKGLIKKLLPCYNKLYFLTWKSKVAKNGQKLILSMKNGLELFAYTGRLYHVIIQNHYCVLR